MAAHGISFSAPILRGLKAHSSSSPSPNNVVPFFPLVRSKRNHKLCCRCTRSSSKWGWNRWRQHFFHMQKAERTASLFELQLEHAIDREDYGEAARLKRDIDEATSVDAVAQIMSQLKSFIDDERYEDASKLCTLSGCGLLGWWVGLAKDFDDPIGRIIQITPGVGRFIATSYSPRQLLTKSGGTPIFEIYVVKNADDTYQMQVVHLERPKRNLKSSIPSSEADKPKPEDKIPGLKMKVININAEEEGAKDDDSVKQLIQEDSDKMNSGENTEEDVNNLDGDNEDTLEADSDASAEEKDSDVKLFVSRFSPDENDPPVFDSFIRLPAELQDTERHNFVLHIPGRIVERDARKRRAEEIYKAAVAAQELLNIMPYEVVNTFQGPDDKFSKVTRSMHKMVKCAISKAQKRGKLSAYTSFNRINNTSSSGDPLEGLYIGAFGAHGLEVVQLKRKFGRWDDMDDTEFEYVEAVKLTGDILVPAGEVAFRAIIDRDHKNINRCRLTNTMGVDATYKGQAQISDFDFKNPRWISGDLLLLNVGKGPRQILEGADMGFQYSSEDKSFIVLFFRLKLPE
ncbi:protein EXECUTER 2, chloroplastic-like isoform X2 [Cicer arietinum]|uniref:protein EXECUTER 2, chloroplastic-like isoform X2 n=1 Tax=Cicer arietinum TaxID=3827 RepID=UPI003CC60EBF